MSAISWTTIEAALHAWVVTGSGLPATSIAFAKQATPRIDPPYVTIDINEGDRVGRPAYVQTDTAGAPVGDEITKTHSAHQTLFVELKAFAATAKGSQSARGILSDIRASLELGSVRSTLNDAKIGIISSGSIIDASGTINAADFEPRAILTVRCLVPSEISETGSYFEKTVITNEIPDPDETFEVGV